LKQAEFQFQKMIEQYSKNIEAKKKQKENEAESLPSDHSEHSNTSAPDTESQEGVEQDSSSIRQGEDLPVQDGGAD
jgi:hypothetical protein